MGPCTSTTNKTPKQFLTPQKQNPSTAREKINPSPSTESSSKFFPNTK